MDWQVAIEPVGDDALLVAMPWPLVFEPNRREILFGRDGTCDVLFSPGATMVSRRHCRLVLSGEGYRLEIFPDRYVELNGQPAEPGIRITDGSVIRLGTSTGPTLRILVASGHLSSNYAESQRAEASYQPEAAPGRPEEPTERSRAPAPSAPPREEPRIGLPLSVTELAREWQAGARARDRTATPPPVWPPQSRAEAPQATAVPRMAPLRRRSLLPLLIGASIGLLIGGVAVWLFWRHSWGASAGLLGGSHSALPAPLGSPEPPPAPPGEEVDVSAFAPALARPGDALLVQVFLHVPGQARTMVELARRSDAEADLRGTATLGVEIARGQVVTIIVEAGGRTIDEPAQRVTWRGNPHAWQFLVEVPMDDAGRRFPVIVRLFIEGIPIGSLRFMQDVAEAGQPANRRGARRGDEARRYRQAFLSYSSSDRAEVLKRAQALRAAHIAFFQDLLSLEPGDRWERRLYEEIDRCDLFLLFWSSEAAKSEWVRKEAEYALGRRDASPEAMPQITPILLEGPPAPAPPESLRSIHFNDPLLYVIAGEERGRA